MCVFVCVFVCMCLCVYVCVCVYMHVFLYASTRVFGLSVKLKNYPKGSLQFPEIFAFTIM